MGDSSTSGYDVLPVNPGVKEIDGQPCYARVQDIAPQLDGVLIMTAPHVTDQVVHDCEAAGVQRVWMHKGEGIGAVSKSAVEFGQPRSISVIDGQCPFMFLPQAVFFHRAHGFVKKMMGSYPA